MRWMSQGEALVPNDDLSWLSATERQRLAGMPYTKRRVGVPPGPVDGEAGRGRCRGPADWTVRAGGHRGQARTRRRPGGCLFDGQALLRRVSLTDRAGWAVCTVSPSGLEVGCDLELVEHRSPAFVADYFTAAEQALAHAAPSEGDWQRVTNLIWSAKESALKVLRTGLRRDTRSVEVTLGDGVGEDWVPLTVRSAEGSTFSGWWRQYGTFILTVAAAEPAGPTGRAGGTSGPGQRRSAPLLAGPPPMVIPPSAPTARQGWRSSSRCMPRSSASIR